MRHVSHTLSMIAFGSAIITVALFAARPLRAAGEPVPLWGNLNIRYQDKGGNWVNSTTNLELNYTIPPYDAVEYTPTDWCGVRAHATKYPAPNGKKFTHIEVHPSFSPPKNSIDDNFKVFVVNEAMVDAAWDYMYDTAAEVSGSKINNVAAFGGTVDWVPYTPQGSIDFTKNCWGYAFGYNFVVQDPTYIWQYDYAEVNDCHLQIGDLIRIRGVSGSPPLSNGADTHVVKIDDVCNDPYSGSANCTKVNKTIEKNAVSHLYLRGTLCNHSYLALFGMHKVYRKIP